MHDGVGARFAREGLHNHLLQPPACESAQGVQRCHSGLPRSTLAACVVDYMQGADCCRAACAGGMPDAGYPYSDLCVITPTLCRAELYEDFMCECILLI